MGHGSSPTLKEGWQKGNDRITYSAYGVCNSISIIIFAFMYQINIPALYTELEIKTLPNMRLVVISGTIMAVILYILAGFFGYMSFAADLPESEIKAIFTDNILKAPYHTEGSTWDNPVTPIVIYISLFGMCLVVSIACPFCVLPCKDSIEEI